MLLAPTSSGGDSGAGIVLLVILFGAYFLPSLVAGARGHHRTGQVFVLNLFLGWTLLGWVIALVMAVGPVQKQADSPAYLPRSATGALPPPKTRQIPCWKCGQLISPTAPMCWKCAAKAEDAPPPTPAVVMRPCPLCAGDIPTTALKCRHCGEWVVPESERPVTA